MRAVHAYFAAALLLPALAAQAQETRRVAGAFASVSDWR